MNPLDHLISLLRPAEHEAARPMSATDDIDNLLSEMVARSKGRKGAQPVEDQQLEAVRRFWESQEVKSFRDAYLLCWSLCLSHSPQGPCILEDRSRLQRVLDGIDTWQGRPSAYRRCYQGLVKSYFTYAPTREEYAPAARSNWRLLRDYLAQRNSLIKDKHSNPEWVDTAIANRTLFGEKPCEPYIDALLRGDSGVIDHLCEQLGINKASWFLRELVLAQVKGATLLGNAQFQGLLPRLLSLLATNEVLRDRGMILVLDRYAELPGTPLHQGMRDHCVGWWGNPWLPSNETRWGGVKPAARAMVADWLKLEFIETFFTKLAEDGLGDPRRMNFWKRYVKSIDHIEFALGSAARNSRERDLVALRQKMKGLVRTLDASANNAFIMHMGSLIAVEFSDMGAFYGYDARQTLPFDAEQTLRLDVNGLNSLKHKDVKDLLWMRHQDGIRGWGKWEDMFEATLRQHYGIAPSAIASTPSARDSQRVESPVLKEYSRSALNEFAQRRGLAIDDKTASGGNLWVRGDGGDDDVVRVLSSWGFRNRPGKGWWR